MIASKSFSNPENRRMDSASRIAAIAQGAYYLSTGIWPILSERTFEKITGPKVDFWLVKTFGALISVLGGWLVWMGLRERVNEETRILAVGSAAMLGASETIYVAKGRISPSYLLDALIELVLILVWGYGIKRNRNAGSMREM